MSADSVSSTKSVEMICVELKGSKDAGSNQVFLLKISDLGPSLRKTRKLDRGVTQNKGDFDF